MVGVAIDPPPMRVPEGTKVSSMGNRSIFDSPAPGSTAQKSLVAFRPDPFMPRSEPAVRPRTMAQPVLGFQDTDTAVERLVQREIHPEGINKTEAGAIAAALGPALEATAKAIEDGVTCGKVDSMVYQEVSKLKASLEQFAASGAEGKAQMTEAELQKIDSVLACQATYQDIESATKKRTVLLVAGGIVIGAIVLAVTT